MSDVKWIKLYTDMFDNRKIKFIRNLPDGNDILLCWIMLLVSAGRCNANGFIFLTESVPYTNDMIAAEFDIPINTVRLAIETFKKLNMVSDDNGVLCVTSWNEYQSADRLDKIRDYDKARKRLARQKQKTQQIPQSCPVDNPEDIQGQSGGLDIIDLDLDLNINNNAEKVILQEMESTKNYPFDYQKDLDFIRRLMEEFPNADIVESLKRWSIWIIDKPLTKKSNPRSQLRNFVKNYVTPKPWGAGATKQAKAVGEGMRIL